MALKVRPRREKGRTKKNGAPKNEAPKGVCCTFRPFLPFSEHFKSKNLLQDVFVLFFSVFRFWHLVFYCLSF